MSSESSPSPGSAPQNCRITQIALLAALLMMGVGTGLFLWNETRQKTSDVALASKMVNDYRTNNEPKIKWFIQSLQNFGKSNPDFNPVLAKYNLLSAGPAAAPAPAKK